jgi:hypothetical protein
MFMKIQHTSLCVVFILSFSLFVPIACGDPTTQDDSPTIIWSDEIWISDGQSAKIVYEKGYLHVGAGSYGDNYIHSMDEGKTWSEPITNIGKGYGIAAQGDNVYSVYSKVKGVFNFIIYNSELYFKKSEDCGNTWSEEIQLCLDPESDIAPRLGVNDNTLHLVWRNPDKNEVYYKRSRTGGCIWEPKIELYPTYCETELAVKGNEVHVICSDWYHDLVYIRSLDNGNSWEYYWLAQNTYNPEITVDQDDVYVVWRDKSDFNIYCLVSNDSGDTWGEIKQITSSGSAGCPDIVAKDKKAFLVYSDKKFGDYQMCLRTTTDTGNSWSNEVRVENNPEFSYVRSMDVNENTLFILWFDGREDGSIFYKKGQFEFPKKNSETKSHSNEEDQNADATIKGGWEELVYNLSRVNMKSFWYLICGVAAVAILAVKLKRRKRK